MRKYYYLSILGGRYSKFLKTFSKYFVFLFVKLKTLDVNVLLRKKFQKLTQKDCKYLNSLKSIEDRPKHQRIFTEKGTKPKWFYG